jgi:hypothetical protein
MPIQPTPVSYNARFSAWSFKTALKGLTLHFVVSVQFLVMNRGISLALAHLRHHHLIIHLEPISKFVDLAFAFPLIPC